MKLKFQPINILSLTEAGFAIEVTPEGKVGRVVMGRVSEGLSVRRAASTDGPRELQDHLNT